MNCPSRNSWDSTFGWPTEEVNTATRLVSVVTENSTSANERFRSGSRAQVCTYIYMRRLKRSVSKDSLPSASKVSTSAKNSHHQELNSQPTTEQREKNQPSCLRTGWGSNNPRTNKTSTCFNFAHPGALPARCQYASTQCQDVRGEGRRNKNKRNIQMP
ncbi:hypothetical protein FHG87_022957 [Trinorchestia longiramus]|nr:hypothetical protein FHG87_022957 [Trinorchestia longiramus]